MIEKALRFITGMDEPHFREHAGRLYTVKHMEMMKYNPKAEPIEITLKPGLIHMRHRVPEACRTIFQCHTRICLSM